MIVASASRQSVDIASQLPAAIISFGNSLEPMPTQVTPALNQADRFSSVGSTAPVAMIIDQGIGALMFFTNDGPPTFPAGKILHRSQPTSWAKPISETEPHPGVYGTKRRLQTFAISGLNNGPTTKLAPNCKYREAVPASKIDPSPNTSSGHYFVANLISSANTS